MCLTYLFCGRECFACMDVCVPCMYLVPTEVRVGILGSPGTGVTGDCKLPCGYGEQSSGSLQEQQVLLTAKLALQPRNAFALLLRGF